MTRVLTQFIGPTRTFGADCRNLVSCAIRAVSRRLTRALNTIEKENRDFAIRQDLAHLDRNQLRDIGLNRDAQ
jgi:uncharacterized protein YjiS (DUF1127 family)